MRTLCTYIHTCICMYACMCCLICVHAYIQCSCMRAHTHTERKTKQRAAAAALRIPKNQTDESFDDGVACAGAGAIGAKATSAPLATRTHHTHCPRSLGMVRIASRRQAVYIGTLYAANCARVYKCTQVCRYTVHTYRAVHAYVNAHVHTYKCVCNYALYFK